MTRYNADLHIHTCLSPCGDLEMSPRNIICRARERGLQLIAITDHNSTRNVRVCMERGVRERIAVIPGCEVNTQEEVHCLCYFPHLEAIERFQRYLDRRMSSLLNDPVRFGYQVAVDENEQIVYEEKRSLFMGIADGIEALERQVHSLGGLFVPAHIDRQTNGILSQLGFIPPELDYDALEVSKRTTPAAFTKSYPELAGKRFLQSSDAHYPEDIGCVHTRFYMEKPEWDHFRRALLEKRFEAMNVPPLTDVS
ncbi:MAG: PHP domain-containing protein [Proteiniphilum sp.]|nr:PHP domain-containing protein [Proteiniphilum sp.]MDD4800919.1 PHP domain-containing protein [Proteiniphilum sp.]